MWWEWNCKIVCDQYLCYIYSVMMHTKVADFVFLNGKIIHTSRAKISPLDSGFLYSMGVYEVWKASQGKIQLFEENFEELQVGLKIMKIPFSLRANKLVEIFTKLLKKNKLSEARVRLTVTRENIFVEVSSLPKDHGSITAFTTLRERSNPAVKSVAWLSTALNLSSGNWWEKAEAILINSKKEITEGSQSNFFLVKNGALITPPEKFIHSGGTRKWVLHVAKKLKITARTRKIKLREAFQADEIFVTGSVRGIRAVVSLDGKKIGNGKIGATTKIFRKEFTHVN